MCIRLQIRRPAKSFPRLVRVRACRLAASNQVDGGCSKARKRRLRPSVFNGIDFVFAGDGNPRWRHLGFLVSGQAGNPAEKAWERVRRHPLFHAFSALALIEYQCSPAKAALRVARFGKWVLKVHSSGLFNSLPSCSRAAFGALTGGRLRLETRQFRITEFS